MCWNAFGANYSIAMRLPLLLSLSIRLQAAAAASTQNTRNNRRSAISWSGPYDAAVDEANSDGHYDGTDAYTRSDALCSYLRDGQLISHSPAQHDGATYINRVLSPKADEGFQ